MLPALVLNSISQPNNHSSGPSPHYQTKQHRTLVSPDLPISYSIGLNKVVHGTTSYKQGLKAVSSSAKNKASTYI